MKWPCLLLLNERLVSRCSTDPEETILCQEERKELFQSGDCIAIMYERCLDIDVNWIRRSFVSLLGLDSRECTAWSLLNAVS